MPGLRVLIAEDETVSAELLRHMAEQEGHEICGFVARGQEVLPAVRQLSPDVVLMDVRLADEVSGIEATRRLLEYQPIPVIVISGSSGREEMRDIAESGALGFMQKPVSPEELRVNLLIAARHSAAMRELRESESLHKGLFDHAAVGMYICHPDGYFLSSNKAFARMLGCGGPGELLRLAHSMDAQLYVDKGRRAEFLADLRQGRKVRDAESQVYGRDGDIIWISEHLTPMLDDKGNLSFYEGIVIDITARKRAFQEKALALSLLRNTVDAIADLVVVCDLDGNIILVNSSFEKNVEQAPGSKQNLRAMLCGKGNCLFQAFLDNMGAEHNKNEALRGSLHLLGCDQPLEASLSPYLAPEGEVMGAVFVMRPQQYEQKAQV